MTENYEFDDTTKFVVAAIGSLHNGTMEATEAILRNFCIESRRRQAQIALVEREVWRLAESPTIVNPMLYMRALQVDEYAVLEWLNAHYDGDWRDYTTRYNPAGF